MQLPTEVENLDSIAPGHRQHYVQNEAGGYRLDAAGIKGRLEADNVRKLAKHEAGLQAQVASLRGSPLAVLSMPGRPTGRERPRRRSAQTLDTHVRIRTIAFANDP
jgi:hypothetical protein